ncbi:ABC transporter permease [Ideonella sp. B7]|uniref:ABC transporter permease n=1 Tax=Ideonella benzenivorans TaxID=2831643 RepID=UPI001CEC439E|nr:ABC transporter permease [Ideonella benzenivorans]MCA6215855.1 ABC transporter permease [Ideonella benzenivorans]
MWGNTFLLALREIRRNLMRSILTMLGIVIGVAAVVTMVTLGNGATASVSSQISSLGSNLIIVMPGQRMELGTSTSPPKFKQADAEAIATQVTGVDRVAPIVTASLTAISSARNWKTSVTGSNENYLAVSNWTVRDGRTFTDVELRAGKSVCIVGDRVRKELYGEQRPVGSDLRLQNFSCQIIGFFSPKGQSSTGTDQDDFILVPIATLQRRVTGNTDVGAILISARQGFSTDTVKTRIERLMRDRRHLTEGEDNNFNVIDTKQISDTLSGTTRILTLLLGAVAAVSLLVGGIGIMNIMLVSVTERTREIGIRLAIGAMASEVLMQFLVEAVSLSAVGGLVGLILAAIASIGLSSLIGLTYSFDVQINLLAFAFSAAIGIVFGYTPAKRAARLNPIEALRHE